MSTTPAGNQQPGPKWIRNGAAVISASFSPDGEIIAVAGYDRTVKLYSATNLQLLRTIKGHGLSVDYVVFSPNGAMLATGGRDGTVKLWDLAFDQDPVFTPGDAQVWGLAFSPDGRYLATAGRSIFAKLWDVTTQKEMKIFRGHADGILDVAFSPDGRSIATASRDKTARLWDVATGKELRSFKGHTAFLISVTFSPAVSGWLPEAMIKQQGCGMLRAVGKSPLSKAIRLKSIPLHSPLMADAWRQPGRIARRDYGMP